MKKCLLLFCLLVVAAQVFGQADSSGHRKCWHVVGVDAVSFIQYLRYTSSSSGSGGSNGFEFFMPIYQLTYRLSFKPGSIRAGFGGSFKSENDDPTTPIPGKALKRVDRQLDWRIGWEFSRRVARRLEAFYGIDLKQGTLLYRNDNWVGGPTGYVTGLKSLDKYRGVAVLYGLRFWWTKRVGLTTSMDYSVYYSKHDRRRYFTPLSTQFGPMPDSPDPALNTFFSRFGPPLMLNVDIAF